MTREQVWLDHVPHLDRVRVRARWLLMADVCGSRHGWDGVDITSIGLGKGFRLWRALLSSSRRASWPTTQTAHEMALFRAGM